MSKIFLSYRRDDTQDVAGRVFDVLVDRFTRRRVFKDIDNIPLGTDFRTVLQGAIENADVVLVLIGPKFLTVAGVQDQRRIDDPGDFVRAEIEMAIQLGKPIIPIVIGSAAMVTAEDLPHPIQKLAFHNGLKVRPDPDFHVDMERLTSAIEELSPDLANARRLGKKTGQGRFLILALLIGLGLGAAFIVISLAIVCTGALGLLADDFSATITAVDKKGDKEMKPLQPGLKSGRFEPSKVTKKPADSKPSDFDMFLDGERDKNPPKVRIVPSDKGDITEILIGGGKKKKPEKVD